MEKNSSLSKRLGDTFGRGQEISRSLTMGCNIPSGDARRNRCAQFLDPTLEIVHETGLVAEDMQ